MMQFALELPSASDFKRKKKSVMSRGGTIVVHGTFESCAQYHRSAGQHSRDTGSDSRFYSPNQIVSTFFLIFHWVRYIIRFTLIFQKRLQKPHPASRWLLKKKKVAPRVTPTAAYTIRLHNTTLPDFPGIIAIINLHPPASMRPDTLTVFIMSTKILNKF